MAEVDGISDYDYELPAELVARHPAEQRDRSRLMVLDRSSRSIQHRQFHELPGILSSGDRLVCNDTRVLPARLFGRREATGGKWEGLFLSADADDRWRLIGETRGKLQPGEFLLIHSAHGSADTTFRLELLSRDDSGTWLAQPDIKGTPTDVLDRFGTMPLPPYIGRKLADDDDRSRYQTVFAQSDGSVAAPTAGLHFTDELLARCQAVGIEKSLVTLHVGIGTFRPVTAVRLDDHSMHSEQYSVSATTCAEIQSTKSSGGRVIAVGTTSVRSLESAAQSGELIPSAGSTDLFIRPPWTFRAIDGMITNFHLPKSTLLVLVSAFAGREFVRGAYAEAIRHEYRFYSYGDAMLIL